jgi:hypothetical protein
MTTKMFFLMCYWGPKKHLQNIYWGCPSSIQIATSGLPRFTPFGAAEGGSSTATYFSVLTDVLLLPENGVQEEEVSRQEVRLMSGLHLGKGTGYITGLQILLKWSERGSQGHPIHSPWNPYTMNLFW